jgi:hypothetical protein
MLLTTGIVAAIALAGCAGSTTATGGTGSPTSTGGATSGGSTFVPVSSATAGNTGGGATGSNGGGEGGGGRPLAGGTPECRSTNLKLSLGPSDGAAGHIFQALRFTNVSAQNCVIVGFPGVSYVTGTNGMQVGPAADRDGAIGSQIVLKPGQIASTIVTFTDVGNFDPAVCKPTPTLGLRVYPPDSTASEFIARNGTGCTGTPPSSQLRIQTIKPGVGSA